jgi:hypothetical protein
MVAVDKNLFDNYVKIVNEVRAKNESIFKQNEELELKAELEYQKELKKVIAKNKKIEKKHQDLLVKIQIDYDNACKRLEELKLLQDKFDSFKNTKLIKIYCSINVELTNVCLLDVEFKEYADFVIESVKDFENFKKYFDDSWYLVKELKTNQELFVQKNGRKYGDYFILDIEILEKKIKVKDISKVDLLSDITSLIQKLEYSRNQKPYLESLPVKQKVKLIEQELIPVMETPEYVGIAKLENDTLNLIRNSWT